MALVAEVAARNNALWCDAVCRANGVPGEFHDTVWINRHTVPPFYSNAVTLTAGGAARQLVHISRLAAERPVFSVKDSFSALDLRPLGFGVLFAANWLWRPADTVGPVAPADWVWSVVENEAELRRWEAVWAGLHADDSIPGKRIFRPALLREPGVVLLAGRLESHFMAVAAANLTEDAVGLSNVFAPAALLPACWAGAVGFVGRLFPGRPLVGYERGDDLALTQLAGFMPVGELRVWARDGTG
jgi:hypothetical protein